MAEAHTCQTVPKMHRTPSAFPFSGRLRRRAINPTPLKRVKEVLYPVVEYTRTDRAVRNHSRSGAPHHKTQSIAKNESENEHNGIRTRFFEAAVKQFSQYTHGIFLIRKYDYNIVIFSTNLLMQQCVLQVK